MKTKSIIVLSALTAMLISMSALAEGLPQIGDVPNGTRLYRMNCTVCHGFDGSGSGPVRVSLQVQPADHGDGALMNARDHRMLFKIIQAGGSANGKHKAMPGFSGTLNSLDTWDLVAHLRSLHLPLTAFFARVDQYLVKAYDLGQLGNKDFKAGQMERLKKAIKKLDPRDLHLTVFTLFKADERRASPELVPQEPRRLAQLKKKDKVGYVFFMDLIGPRGKRIPVGVSLDLSYSITKLVATGAEPAVLSELNNRLAKYVGMGKRGDAANFRISKDKVGKKFDAAVTRVYALAVEGANAYELEERERSWADNTF